MSHWIDVDNTSFFLNHTEFNNYAGYTRSFYFALVGMSTVGYGDITPQNEMETSVASIIILVGGLLLPAVVGGLASLMGNMNSGQVPSERAKRASELFEHPQGQPHHFRIARFCAFF